jgi:hypothetical protein
VGQMDGQTDMTKLKATFNFANTPINVKNLYSHYRKDFNCNIIIHRLISFVT